MIKIKLNPIPSNKNYVESLQLRNAIIQIYRGHGKHDIRINVGMGSGFKVGDHVIIEGNSHLFEVKSTTPYEGMVLGHSIKCPICELIIATEGKKTSKFHPSRMTKKQQRRMWRKSNKRR